MLDVNKLRSIGVAIAASIVLVALAQTAQADPPNGTCKTNFEIAISNSPATAQQVWVATVSGKFGTKWAHWVGAKNKTIVPMNNGAYYQALGKPCFYQPVT